MSAKNSNGHSNTTDATGGAESPYQKFFWLLVAALIGALFIGAGSVVTSAVNNATITTKVESLTKQMEKLEASVSATSTDRYTGAMAATDRTAFLTAFTDIFKQTDARLTIGDVKDADQDRQINELMGFRATVIERLKLGGKS